MASGLGPMQHAATTMTVRDQEAPRCLAPLPHENRPSPPTEIIRPFRVDVPQEEIDDLRRRIEATRWPEKETVADQSQGVQLATIQELARYWAHRLRLRAGSRRG